MSARWTITDEIGRIRLGTLDLPGVYTSLEIGQSVRIDRQEIPGQSGAKKQVTGYDDATVTITLCLYSDDNETCFAKLRKIQSLFRKTDNSAKPEVFRILNEHTEARGIDRVLFVDFRSHDTNENDFIEATLELEEYIPVIPVAKEGRADRPAVMASALKPWTPDAVGGAGTSSGNAAALLKSPQQPRLTLDYDSPKLEEFRKRRV